MDSLKQYKIKNKTQNKKDRTKKEKETIQLPCMQVQQSALLKNKMHNIMVH